MYVEQLLLLGQKCKRKKTFKLAENLKSGKKKNGKRERKGKKVDLKTAKN